MKKGIIVICIAVLLFTIALSGCLEGDKDTSDEEEQLNIVVMNSQREEILTVNEGDTFIVKVIDENENPIEGVIVNFSIEVLTTEANGEVVITAPFVTSSMPYSIEASYEGYVSAIDTIMVYNVPKLVIELDSSFIEAGTEFQVTIRDETANRRVGVTVTFNGMTYITSADGEVDLIAPNDVGEYNITASHPSCVDTVATVTII